jgi:hypothetical protein
MKKLAPVLFILVISLLSIRASLRPTNGYVIFYDYGQSTVVDAQSVDEALFIFRREFKHKTVYSVARQSYVQSIWIWTGDPAPR